MFQTTQLQGVLFFIIFASLLLGACPQSTFSKHFIFRGKKGYYDSYKNGSIRLLNKRTYGGASFRSIKTYLHGYFSVKMKLPCGFSAGVVSTFFMSNGGYKQDEIDFEFLGHVVPQMITVHTNVIAKGIGGREEGFFLWFNPCKDFHTYTIWWSSDKVVWLVDDFPIRVHYRANFSTNSTDFPTRPMYIYGSIWRASGWATQGGLIKPEYDSGPWAVYYRNFNLIYTCRYSTAQPNACLGKPRSWDVNLTGFQNRVMGEKRLGYLRYTYKNR